jgi:citrate synthase
MSKVLMSFDEVFERLSYDPGTGIFIWKERVIRSRLDKTWNKKFAGKETGYLRHNGYKVINMNKKEYSCSRLAWLLTYKVWPTKEIDHINGNSADNRIENLREATRSENAINRSMQSNNSSGLKGIWKRKGMNIWVADIQRAGKKFRVGSFKSPEEAHQAYKLAALDIHGEFVRHE